MEFVERRQKDPEYLKTVIAQRQIVIEEREREKTNLQKQNGLLQEKISRLESKLGEHEESSLKEITNLKQAILSYQQLNEEMKQEKSELEYKLNQLNKKMLDLNKEHTKEIYKLKNDFESQKEALNMKIHKLEKNLSALNTQYHVEQAIQEDKHQIIEDANRNLKGFANEHQQRMIIIQNQQLSIEIEFQSRQISSLHEKNEKLQEQIKQYKTDLQLHKNIENDLVKRSSLAQNLIKQLNRRIKELENKIEINLISANASKVSHNQRTEQSRSSYLSNSEQDSSPQIRQLEQTIAKLKFENAKLENYNHFLQNTNKSNNKKYETLGQIMGQYLEAIMYLGNNSGASDQIEGTGESLTINLTTLKQKDLREWTKEEIEVILNLLFVQIKPFISNQSLTRFPEAKNIKVSFVEEQNKEALSLPKIMQQYEKNHEKQISKNNRFKDIPVDISTKILRSNLREWGQKINYGSMPKGRKIKSKSIIEPNRSFV